MRKRVIFIGILVLVMGCNNEQSDTSNSVSINLKGTLNGETIDIQSGFCVASQLADNSFSIIIGTNRAFTKGVLLVFDSLADITQGTYTLPDSRLIAGYDIDTTATSGTVTFNAVSISDGKLKSLSGSADLVFSGASAGSVTGTFECLSVE